MVSLRNGHDVRYFTNHGGAGGCAGAMAYYTKAGEPPGEWYGKAAGKLGLFGEVDPQVIDALFMDNTAPTGEVLAGRVKPKNGEAAALTAYKKAYPYASATEIAEFKAAERAKGARSAVPYVDLTTSAAKSVSVLHASYRVDAMLARADGRTDEADALDARADAIEAALLDAAGEAVQYLEQHNTFTRTGHHSATTGEYRDGDGLAAGLFMHHLSRDGDPQLHVHAAIWNRVQRADGADDKWRTLWVRDMMRHKLGLA